MANFKPPDGFDFSSPESWPVWKSRFERYRSLSKLDEADESRQVSTLLYSMGAEAETIFAALDLDDEDRKKWSSVTEALNNYFQPSVNVIHQRTIFERCVQETGEKVEEFVRRLRAAAKYCEFKDIDERIRDRLVAHMTNREVSKELQLISHDRLTLAHAILKARQNEQVTREVLEQCASEPHTSQPATTAAVATKTTSRTFRNQRASTAETRGENGPLSSRPCQWCGSVQDHKGNRNSCPAKGQTCYACGKTGHFSAVCRNSRNGRHRQSVDTVAITSETPESTCIRDSGYQFVGMAGQTKNSIDKPWTATLQIGGAQTTFKIDTGADVTIMTRPSYNLLPNPPPLEPSSEKLHGPSGESLNVDGQFKTTVRHRSCDYKLHVIVISGSTHSNLLSRKMSLEMGLVKRVDSSQVSRPLGRMLGRPATIHLKPGSVPYNCVTARRVPIPILSKVKEELSRMQLSGVIEPIATPTDWCAPMVPVVKRDGGIRICVDLKRLNDCVMREHFPLPTVDDTLARLRGASVFSTLDLTSGFWQIPLAKDCSDLATFITPFGRFKFNRLPFGITSAPEIFQRRLQQLLDDVPGALVFIDDIIVFGDTMSKHDEALDKTCQRLNSAGLTLNETKCHYRQSQVKFLGHSVNAQGVSPDPAKIAAIAEMPTPRDVNDLRRALGLFTFLAKFLPELATIAAPLRRLLRRDSPWTWNQEEASAFSRLKSLAAASPCLAFYDPRAKTRVTADASSYGVGGALEQLQTKTGTWQPVAYASRTLTKAEQRYAQLEKELLAVVWCCEHFRQYLYGAPQFTVHTDHKPLVPLVNTRDLDNVPIRCQRLLIRLLRYDVKAEYIPGANLIIADTLSRAPRTVLDAQIDTSLHEDSEATIAVVTSSICSVSKETEIRQQTQQDPVLQKVIHFTQHGWSTPVSEDLQPFYRERGLLAVHDGILRHGLRLVIPSSMRQSTLESIHNGHQGIVKCKARAKHSVWWPKISQSLEEYIANCETCSLQRHQPPEPLQPSEFPSLPWKHIAVDLFQHQQQVYLVIVDYFSRFIHACQLHRTTTSAIIKAMKAVFAIHGIPQEVSSDNGPQFSCSEFMQFAKTYDFIHRTSSPYHPQGNGEAERAVQTMKRLLTSNDSLHEALLQYRSTPLANGYSPAELLFGRRIRTLVPCADESLEPKWPDIHVIRKTEMQNKQYQQYNYDSRHRAKPLPTLSPGTEVFVTDQNKKAVVKNQLTDRSYSVQTDNGASYRRNRQSLVKLPCNNCAEGQTHGEEMPSLPASPKASAMSDSDGSLLPTPSKATSKWKLPPAPSVHSMRTRQNS